MTFEDRINDEYFEWLCGLIDSKRFSSRISYRKLLMHLHNIEFTWSIPHDDNRADDGVQLRRRYGLINDDDTLPNYILGPCSVLEMMVALALRCEEWIMDDAQMGDRTGQWFWGMIHNLGLSPMTDSKFDRDFVDDVVARLLNREYEPDGRGGLFTVRNCEYDLRTVEIWRQLSWYLGSIT
jgi:hypothetical protein